MTQYWPIPQHALTEDEATTFIADRAAVADETPIKPLPDDALILLPMRNLVLFPGMASPVTIGRAQSVAAAQAAVHNAQQVGLLLQRDAHMSEVRADDLHWVGTHGRILRYVASPGGAHHLVVQGERRFRVLEFLEGWPFMVARVSYIDDAEDGGAEIEARLMQLKQAAGEAIALRGLARGLGRGASPDALSAQQIRCVRTAGPAARRARCRQCAAAVPRAFARAYCSSASAFLPSRRWTSPSAA